MISWLTLLLRYCNNRVAVFDKTGKHKHDIRGDWSVVHSVVLFEDQVSSNYDFLDFDGA